VQLIPRPDGNVATQARAYTRIVASLSRAASPARRRATS
jgi:hypothetical protein